jgi:hypothetical protein
MAQVNKLLTEAKRHPAEVGNTLRKAVKARQLNYKDLDYTSLFFESFGFGEAMSFLKSEKSFKTFQESAGSVTTGAFQNLTSPFVEQALVNSYEVPAAVLSGIIPSTPTRKRYEVKRGIANVGDETQVVEEGKDYPEVGVGPNWIQTPEVLKRGFILSFTKESLLFDETGQLLEQGTKASEYFRLNFEKQAIRCVIDQGETETQRYRYVEQGTSYATYQASAPWANLRASSALADGVSIDNAVQTFMQIQDPATGEPANFTTPHLLVPPGLYRRAVIALGGTFTQATGGYPTSGDPGMTEVDNPTVQLWGDMTVVRGGELLRAALGNSTSWIIGDLTKAFTFMEAIPFSAKQQGEESDASFSRDVIQRFKVSRMGTYATLNPRHVLRCNA